jgi:hypothetical protein
MAENNIDNPSFSIENTMDLGVGSIELINELREPETVSAKSEDLEPIVEEIPKEKEKSSKKKEIPKEKEKEKEEEENKEEETNQDIISNFLEENKEEETTGETTTKLKEEEEEIPETTSKFNALAKDLFKLGVFTKDEEEDEEPVIESAEDFLERFQNEKKKGATETLQNFIGQFGEDYQNAFDAIFVKGASPKEYFAVYNAVVDYAQMDMTNKQNQETVVRQALTDQGFEPEDIKTEIERLESYGDLETVAAKHHKVLVKKEAVKLQQIEQKAEQDLKQKTIIRNQYISNVQNILQDKVKAKEFDGIPINPKLANELQDFLLVDKWKTPSGETLTDFDRAILELKRPENHANKVKLGLLLKIMEKDPTLSVIQKSVTTKKNDQIFSETAKQVSKKTVNTDGSIRKNPFITL